MSDLTKIIERKRKLEREDERNRKEEDAIAERRRVRGVELAELETAGSVVARLTGEKWPPKDQDDNSENPSEPVNKKTDGLPTMPELIVMALRQTKRPMTPKEISEHIRRTWWPKVETKKIGTIAWRLDNRGDLEKIEGTSAYQLPQTEEPPDDEIGVNTSEGSLFETQAKGREAVPGGGP